MKIIKEDLYAYVLVLLISLIFVSDIFLTNKQFASFDSPFHITNIAQFYNVLQQGEFPVRWMGGFANYGLPIPLIAHQLTSYLGAFITFVTHNPLTSYHILILVGITCSNLFYYQFLRLYVSSRYAFIGTFLFNFTIYRVINIYVRGAMPEVFSSMFLPLILLCIYHAFVRQKSWALIGLLVSFFLLTLNHPMMLLIYSFIIFPYFLYVICVDEKGSVISSISYASLIKKCTVFGFVVVIGVGMAAYYILPLTLEIKYFYYGLTKNHLTPGNYLTITNAIPALPYFTDKEIFPRGHTIGLGIVESVTLLIGAIFVMYTYIVQKKKTFSLLAFSIVVSLVLLFFTSRFSAIFYEHITPLSNIQFPWRILSALTFFPPLILAHLLYTFKKDVFLPIIIFIIAVISFPQLYGKNYVAMPLSSYYFTTYNVHSIMMNTIWTGKTEEYPVEPQKGAIIEGKGVIQTRVEKNNTRTYTVTARTPVRMVDHTFYFPGWTVAVDGKTVPIEYQDPEYRGVMTYNVPEGNHTVTVSYQNTKIRWVASLLSCIFGVFFIVVCIFRQKIVSLYIR